MEKKIKDIQFKKKFKFSKDQDLYTFQLKKKRNYWWLLLCLLPLLLFIRCDHDITVQTIDRETDLPVMDIPVTLSYRSNLLFDNGHFLPKRDVIWLQTTDSTGTAIFKDIKCDVFSYIFYCMSKAYFSISSNCHEMDPDPYLEPYHYTRNVKLYLDAKREDVKFLVKDKETGRPLADAKIEYQYVEGSQQHSDSVRSNANGEAVVKRFPICSVFDVIKVSCYGYVDTLANNKSVSDINQNAFLLRPVKQSFSYFVKNKRAPHQPIPGAKCVVTLTDNGANTTIGTSTTNVDGVGKGVYNDAFILAHLDIEASKLHYKNGKLEGNYTVEQFIALPDSQRVIYLEPEPYVQEFQNVDSLTNQPIAGVTNEITVTDFDGNSITIPEISNSNGIFPVKAKEGDKIDIISKLEPDYLTKETHIAKFDTAQIIRMMPDTVSITFRTIDDETGDLLPDCNLIISTSKTNIKVPVTSGKGEFVVSGLYRGEQISIVSSKKGYNDNDYQIKDSFVNFLLNAQQRARDIRMSVVLLPCDENVNHQEEKNVPAGTVSPPKSYNMNANSGRFRFEYNTGEYQSDCIDIYNHKPNENYMSGKKIWSSGQVKTNGWNTEIIEFSNGSVITVIVITGPADDSYWNYKLSCPLP